MMDPVEILQIEISVDPKIWPRIILPLNFRYGASCYILHFTFYIFFSNVRHVF